MEIIELEEVYQKYKHLDHLLSDREWLGDSFQYEIIFDLWQSVKAALEVLRRQDWK